MGKPPTRKPPEGHQPPGHGGTPPGQGPGGPPGQGPGGPPGQRPDRPERPPEPPVDAAPEHPIVIPPEVPPEPPVDAAPEHPIVIPPEPEQPPEEITPPDPPPAGTLQAIVDLSGGQFVYNEADGTDVGTYQDPDGRFAERCTRTVSTDCPIRVDFRRMEGRVSVVFGQGAWNEPTHLNLPRYRVTIVGDELTSPVEIDVPSHGSYQRHRWYSNDWPLPMRKMSDIYDKKLMPRFDPDLTRGTDPYPGRQYHYTPMGLAGLFAYMPTTGGRGDIGHVTSAQGHYMANEDNPDALADVMAQAEAAGTFTWDFYDRDTGAVIDPIMGYPQSTLYSEQAGTPYITWSLASNWVDVTISGPAGTVLSANGSPPDWNMVVDAFGVECRVPVDTMIPASGSVTVSCEVYGTSTPGPASINPPVEGVSAEISDNFVPGTGIYLDSAHQPAVSYLPFLLTGDPYHLENLQRQAVFIIMENPSAPVRSYGVLQPRATGWSARTLAAVTRVSPENPPSWLLPRSIFHQALKDWAANFVYNETVLNGDPIADVLHLASRSFAGGEDNTYSWYQPWQEDICSGGWGWIALLHPDMAQWREIVDWKARNAIARLDENSGWSCPYASSYVAKAAVTDLSDVYTSWSDAWAGNAPFLGDPRPAEYSPDYPPFSGDMDYPGYLSCSLAIAWQAGVADVEQALIKLETGLIAGLEQGSTVRPIKQAIAGPMG